MAKFKTAATGRGYLGEVMVHKISRQVGIVEQVVEATAGWPPEITLKLQDGSLRKGRLSDFKEASREVRRRFSEEQPAAPAEKAEEVLVSAPTEVSEKAPATAPEKTSAKAPAKPPEKASAKAPAKGPAKAPARKSSKRG